MVINVRGMSTWCLFLHEAAILIDWEIDIENALAPYIWDKELGTLKCTLKIYYEGDRLILVDFLPRQMYGEAYFHW